MLIRYDRVSLEWVGCWIRGGGKGGCGEGEEVEEEHNLELA